MTQSQLFGPYRLEELIGRGGMGEVYRAYDTVRDRTVALKILPSAMAVEPHFEARFRREAQLLARLSAPHIIPIHDFGEIDGRLFLDMRLVRGVDLATVLTNGPLTPARAVEMISQVAGALDAAHADGLVHRDVKPSNVLYAGDPRERPAGRDDADFVYLVDFGIARSLEPTEGPSLTRTGHAVGTLAYMAPERFSGERADRRVDVYALACTLYEALTGRPAFAGEALAALMYAHLQRMPAPASTVNPAVPAALDRVLATGLAKRPDDRYGTAGQLAEAARAAVRGTPARSRPVPTRPDLTAPVDMARHPPPPDGPPQPPPRDGQRRPGPFRLAAPEPVWPDPARPAPRDDRGPPPRSGPRSRRGWTIGAAVLGAAALIAGVTVGAVTQWPSGGVDPPSSRLADCADSPLTCNTAGSDELAAGGQVTMAIDYDITNWNVVAVEGFAGPATWAMGTVLPHTFTIAPDLSTTLNSDLLAAAEQTDPTTIVYTLKPDAVWNDNTPVSVDDFILNWRLRNGRDCPECAGVLGGGYERIVGISGDVNGDGARTVTVRLSAPYPDWRSLFASTEPLYPAHLAARQGDLGTPGGLRAAFDWFSATVPTYSAGPLQVQSWRPGQSLVLERNPSWYGQPARLDRVVLQVMTDPAAQVDALQAGRVQLIAPTAAPPELLPRLRDGGTVQSYLGPGLAWERLEVNVRKGPLADQGLRRALFTAIDVKRLREIGAAEYGRAEPMTNHNFVPGQPGYADVLTHSGQGTGDLAAARELLASSGYRGAGIRLAERDGTPLPALRVGYPSYSRVRQREAEYLVEVGAQLGLAITPTPAGTLSLLTGGDFDLYLSGWGISPAQVADARQNWSTGGAGNFTGFSDTETDGLLAAADSAPDLNSAYGLVNQADQRLTAASVVLPLYRRPTLLALRPDLAGVRDNPVAGPLYNVAEWGLRTS